MLKRFKKFWKSVNGFQVYLVDGATIRRDQDMDFNWGGHHLRYGFIPDKEIWIENLSTTQEKDFVLLHELHEVHLMDEGMDYEKAHSASNKVERKARKNPKLLTKLIELEAEHVD